MKLEPIIAIREHHDRRVRWPSMSGWEVVTSKTTYGVYIDDSQHCCEDWGYFATLDKPEDFVGATLMDVQSMDTAHDVTSLVEMKKDHHGDDIGSRTWFGGDDEMIFVNFVTNRGVFQLAVYNEHNGYYGHKVRIKIGETIIEDRL